MKMRYSDRVGVVYFWNQNSFIRMLLKRMKPEENEAAKDIMEALFDKADDSILDFSERNPFGDAGE